MSEYKLKNEDFSGLDPKSKIIIITSEFNENYTLDLEEINKSFLIKNGFNNIKTYKVPWALEIPWLANKLIIEDKKIDLIICIWVVIKWETPHFDYVCSWSAHSIAHLNITYTVPIINWIITCLSEEQVKERISDNYALSGLKILREYKR